MTPRKATIEKGHDQLDLDLTPPAKKRKAPPGRTLCEIFAELDGAERKADGIAKVTDHSAGWVERAVALIADMPVPEFTSDEFRDYGCCLGPPHHKNCWGAALNSAAKQKIIERIGFCRSVRASAHARFVSRWRKL